MIKSYIDDKNSPIINDSQCGSVSHAEFVLGDLLQVHLSRADVGQDGRGSGHPGSDVPGTHELERGMKKNYYNSDSSLLGNV